MYELLNNISACQRPGKIHSGFWTPECGDTNKEKVNYQRAFFDKIFQEKIFDLYQTSAK